MGSVGGRYRLDEQVGRGGMAVVWRGYDLVLHRTVAVKVWSPAGDPEPAVARRMLQEAMAAARLNHPRIARVFDYGEEPGRVETTPYLVLEFVEGETLAARLLRGPLPWGEAVRVCAGVAEALAAAHAAGLVHRDVKPANVMLSPDGVKVVDFGVAAPAGHETRDEQGRVWGTLPYLAPEQVNGGPAMPAGDVYSLGMVLSEALAGNRRPLRRRRRRPAPMTTLPHVRDLPHGVVSLHRRCVSPLPDERPSAAEAARAFRASTVVPAHPGGARRKPLMRLATVAAGSAAVLAVPAVAAVMGERSSDAARPTAVDDSVMPAGCAARYVAQRNAEARSPRR